MYVGLGKLSGCSFTSPPFFFPALMFTLPPTFPTKSSVSVSVASPTRRCAPGGRYKETPPTFKEARKKL